MSNRLTSFIVCLNIRRVYWFVLLDQNTFGFGKSYKPLLLPIGNMINIPRQYALVGIKLTYYMQLEVRRCGWNGRIMCRY